MACKVESRWNVESLRVVRLERGFAIGNTRAFLPLRDFAIIPSAKELPAAVVRILSAVVAHTWEHRGVSGMRKGRVSSTFVARIYLVTWDSLMR